VALSGNSDTFEKYLIEPLKKQNRAAFSCGNESLNKYLKEQASQDAKNHVAAPFVLINKISNTVIGYYTLSSMHILLNELPSEIIGKLPKYPHVPATLLGRLAVDKGYQGKKLGEFLLMDALYKTLITEIATAAMVVDAIDDNAISFYKNFKFIEFPNNPNRLFIQKKTIIKMFE